jgi:hypothetical protein
MNERKNIDDLFAKGLKTYKAKAPAHAWENLSADLDRKQSYKKLLFVRLAAASIAILIAFGAGYFYADFQKQKILTAIEQLPATQNTPEEKIVPSNSTFVTADSNPSQNEPENKIVEKDTQSTEITEQASFVAENALDLETESKDLFASPVIARSNDLNKMKILSFENVLIESSASSTTMLAKSDRPDSYEFIYSAPEGPEYTFGENLNNNKTNGTKWTVGAYFAPTYSYREISTNLDQQGSVNYAGYDQLDANEEALMSYAGGVNVDLALNKRWGLQSGMYYSRIGQINSDALEYTVDSKGDILYAIHTSTGSINLVLENVPDRLRVTYDDKDSIVDNSGLASVEQNFDLFEVPFLLKYKMLDRKFSINLSGGLSPAYVVQNNTYLKIDDEKINVGDSPNLNSVLVNTSIGLGLEYKAFKKLSISLEPTFKYSLVPLNKNSQFFYHPYYMSWFTGIKYRF